MRFNKKFLIIVGVLFALLIGGISFPLLMERVDAGTYKIAQRLNGQLVVLDRPGWHYTGYVSNITKYSVSGIYQFSDNDEDEGGNSIGVIFRDGTKGHVNGNIQFMLPIDNQQRIALHTIYGRNYKQVVNNLIIKTTSEGVKSTSPFFKGEGAYSYDKANFINMVESQLEKGMFAQVKEEKKIKDADGNDFIETIVYPKKNENGEEVISKESKFQKFGVTILGLNIEDIKLDDKAMGLIEKKKEAEFQKIVARSRAEEAKQSAITAKEKAKEMVEIAKGQEEVNKMKAVVEAQKEKEVAKLRAEQKLASAELNRQAAEEDAKALLVKKQAEAKAAELLVKAGITPLEKAKIEMNTKIGVARELSKMNVPNIVVTGGKDGSINPLDMIGVNQALEIQNKMK